MRSALITVDANQSLGASYTSPVIPMGQNYAVSIEAIWTSTPVGTFTIQTSLDYQPGGPSGTKPFSAGTWDDYPNSSTSSSGVNSVSWDVVATGARWVRVNFTRVSGSGTLTSLLAEVKGA